MSKNRSESAMSPGWATFIAGSCTALGVLSFLGGILVACVAGGSPNAPDSTQAMLVGFGMIVSSFIWFAIGCCVALLSQIQQNTAACQNLPENPVNPV